MEATAPEATQINRNVKPFRKFLSPVLRVSGLLVRVRIAQTASRMPAICQTDRVSWKKSTEKTITTATLSRITGYATLAGRYLRVSICVIVADVKLMLLMRDMKSRKGICYKGPPERRRRMKLAQVTVPMKV